MKIYASEILHFIMWHWFSICFVAVLMWAVCWISIGVARVTACNNAHEERMAALGYTQRLVLVPGIGKSAVYERVWVRNDGKVVGDGSEN